MKKWNFIPVFVLVFSFSAVAQAQQGILERINVFGQSLEGNLMGESDAPEVSIYTPASYGSEPNRRYPVVYILHGYSGTDQGWFGPDGRRQAELIADTVFASGAAQEMILVMPNCYNAYGGCMYANSVTPGYWEDYISDDLVAYIDSMYRTIPVRAARGLAGHSMGGYGVMRIGMNRPDVFSSLYALSSCCLNEMSPRGGERALEMEFIETAEDLAESRGALRTFAVTAAWAPNPDKPPFYFDLPTENGEVIPEVAARFAANSPTAMLDSHVGALRKMTAIMMDVGEQDGLIGANRELSEAMTTFGVDHTFETYEGDHTSNISERFEQSVLPFFSKHLMFN
jgi:S-formylglutathione hydrolase